METNQQKSSEAIIPAIEHDELHFGSGRVSVLNIRAIEPRLLRKRTMKKSSEVIIPVLEHGKLLFGSGRVSVIKIMIKIAISRGASLRTPV